MGKLLPGTPDAYFAAVGTVDINGFTTDTCKAFDNLSYWLYVTLAGLFMHLPGIGGGWSLLNRYTMIMSAIDAQSAPLSRSSAIRDRPAHAHARSAHARTRPSGRTARRAAERSHPHPIPPHPVPWGAKTLAAPPSDPIPSPSHPHPIPSHGGHNLSRAAERRAARPRGSLSHTRRHRGGGRAGQRPQVAGLMAPAQGEGEKQMTLLRT